MFYWKINSPRLLQGSRAEVKRLDFPEGQISLTKQQTAALKSSPQQRGWFSLLIDSEVKKKKKTKKTYTHMVKKGMETVFPT